MAAEARTTMRVGFKTVDGEPLAAMITQLSLSSRDRTCSIFLSNRSSSILINPHIYMDNGYCASPPELTVDQGARAIFAFGTGRRQMDGAEGVVTYDIAQSRRERADGRLAIMFSVPTDYDKRDNMFAMGIFDITQPCNCSLYKMMYENSGTFRREKPFGSEISYEGEKYIIRGAMTQIMNGEVKVELWDREFC